MFSPTKPDDIPELQDQHLSEFLPSAKDDRHEYKSRAVKNESLSDKIAKAVSGFWNSGGGLFVAGVDGNGQPDGGISLNVGRQPRRDWIDWAISSVTPKFGCAVHSSEDNGCGSNIEPSKGVFLIGFGDSEIGSHTAIGDKLRLKARCQGNFRWWLKEQGLPSADGLGKGSENQLNLGFSLSFDNP